MWIFMICVPCDRFTGFLRYQLRNQKIWNHLNLGINAHILITCGNTVLMAQDKRIWPGTQSNFAEILDTGHITNEKTKQCRVKRKPLRQWIIRVSKRNLSSLNMKVFILRFMFTSQSVVVSVITTRLQAFSCTPHGRHSSVEHMENTTPKRPLLDKESR